MRLFAKDVLLIAKPLLAGLNPPQVKTLPAYVQKDVDDADSD